MPFPSQYDKSPSDMFHPKHMWHGKIFDCKSRQHSKIVDKAHSVKGIHSGHLEWDSYVHNKSGGSYNSKAALKQCLSIKGR